VASRRRRPGGWLADDVPGGGRHRQAAAAEATSTPTTTMSGVSLQVAPETLVAVEPLWTLAVNLNQNLLGKIIVVANRPVESVAALRPDEWTALHREIARVTTALDKLFSPDQYNHAFLMNVDAQVHLHVIPRYRHARSWSGEDFSDPHFGTLFGTEQRVLEPVMLASLAATIRNQLP
jgi:diadenosine tetraphosphate (Ap4A) HIT family hydrolase